MPKVVPYYQTPLDKPTPDFSFGIIDFPDEPHPLDWLFEKPTGLWVCD
jgi:hypothetical protein